MLSDETNLNERIGQRNKAQLNVKNPQIINGGQTAYTLSRIFEETKDDEREALFAGKEVLLKLITVNTGSQSSPQAKVNLIDSISIATNQQTIVIIADRYSNEPYNIELQKRLFDRYGLLYERKRGEFQDGVYQHYIEREQILERNLFFRVHLSANGQIKRAVEKKAFERSIALREQAPTDDELDRFYFAYLCLPFLAEGAPIALRGNRLMAAKLFSISSWYKPLELARFPSAAAKASQEFMACWVRFLKHSQSQASPFLRTVRDKKTNEKRYAFNSSGWLASDAFLRAVNSYSEVEEDGSTTTITAVGASERPKTSEKAESGILERFMLTRTGATGA